MTKYLLFIYCISILMLQANDEMILRAYYVGKGTPERISEIYQVRTSDPFADEVKAPAFQKRSLSAAPYESLFFKEGDQLWDFTGLYERLNSPQDHVKSAVFNETTGRFVVEANEDFHLSFQAFLFERYLNWPFTIEGKFEFYKVPRESFSIFDWNADKRPEESQKLTSVVLTTRSGSKISIKKGNSPLSVEWEPHIGTRDFITDHRMTIGGTLDGVSFHSTLGFATLNHQEQWIELGQLGEGDEVLVLRVHGSHFYYYDGVRKEDLVLDKDGKGHLHANFYDTWQEIKKEEIDPKTGKILRRYQVPPTFVSFIDEGDSSGINSGGDPFADDDGHEDAPSKVYPNLKNVDQRGRARKFDRVIDLQKILENMGLQFSGDDYAVLNQDLNQLTAQLSPKNIELLDALVLPVVPEPPRNLACSIALLESDQEFTVADLNRAEIKCLGKLSLLGKPGMKSEIAFQMGEKEIKVEFEPNIGVNSQIIDLRTHFTLKNGSEAGLDWKTGLSLWSGAPQIVYRQHESGKWQALLIEVEAQISGRRSQ